MMYKVYILKSKQFDHYYVGQTKNLEKRLSEHNSGNIHWSNRYKPWKIVYWETFKTRKEALQREKYFKSHGGRNWLKKNLCVHSSMDRATPL